MNKNKGILFLLFLLSLKIAVAIYDPQMGRFLSVDPQVPNPESLQDYNRYSYVRNNPLVYFDPNGESPSIASMSAIQNVHEYKYFSVQEIASGLGQAAIDVLQEVGEAAQYGNPYTQGYSSVNHTPSPDQLSAVGEMLEPIRGFVEDASGVSIDNPNSAAVQTTAPILAAIGTSAAGSVDLVKFAPSALTKLDDVAVSTKRVADDIVDSSASLKKGSFSITGEGFKGYPEGLPKPEGPFRLLDGSEYDVARSAANRANSQFRRENNLIGQPVEIHEVKPVKFDGSPTNSNNKIILDRDEHRQVVTPWWNRLLKDLTSQED